MIWISTTLDTHRIFDMIQKQITKNLCLFYITTIAEFKNKQLKQSVDYFTKNIQSEYKFDILFYFDNFPRRKRRFFTQLKKYKKCENVNDVIIINNNIPKHENFYFTHIDELNLNKFPMGSSHGVNFHFYKSINNLFLSEYKNFMLLESDTMSVGLDWFDKLLHYCENNEFIIAGSKYKGENKEKVYKEYYGGNHINGVALYKNSKLTQNTINESKKFLINTLKQDSLKSKRRKRCNGFLNYDVALYEYAKKNKLLNYIHNTDFITNLSLPVNDEIETKKFLSEYPNTKIIHKKNLYKKQDIKSGIKILKENKVYRVADLFYMDGNRWQQDRDAILNNSEYKDTILFDYLMNMNHEQDFECFKTIALNHATKYKQKPEHEDLVLHLRLGDSFDINGRDKIDNRVNWSYHQYKVFFRKNRDYLKTVENVKIVTAMNFGADELTGNYFYTKECYDESMKFVDYILKRLKSLNCNVQIISNENIDIDICYIMQSKHFAPGLSKFSTLLFECLKNDAKFYRNPITKYI